MSPEEIEAERKKIYEDAKAAKELYVKYHNYLSVIKWQKRKKEENVSKISNFRENHYKIKLLFLFSLEF